MSNWEYMTKEAAVIPFTPGTVVWVDGMLSTIYYRLKEKNLLEDTFCGDNPNHDQFIRMFDPSKKVAQILCEVEDAGKPQEQVHPVGMSWVELPKGEDGQRAAMPGFAFIKRSRYMLDLGMLGVHYWMHGLKIDVLHGVQLESNRAAKRFSERLGFTTTGIVPKFHHYRGELVGARAMILEKEDFEPRFEKWLENKKGVESAV